MTQILRLLKLAPEVLDAIAAFGTPFTSPIVTERKLRPMVNLPEAEQKRRLKEMLI